MEVTSNLSEIRKTQIRRVRSSIKVTTMFSLGGNDLRWSPNIIMDKSNKRLGLLILQGKIDSVLFSPYTHITRQGRNINFRKKVRK